MAYNPTLVDLVSTVNSSVATLTSGSVFTGTSENVSQYKQIQISIISDVASATDGLSLQQSTNGTNWDIIDVYTISAAAGKTISIGVLASFFRVVYTNGGTNQASFRLQVVYKTGEVKSSSQRPQDARSNDNDFEETLGYNMVYDPILNVWNRQQIQDTHVIGQSAQTATVNNILTTTSGASSTDCIAFRSISVQVVSTGTGGTYIFEESDDGTNFQPLTVFSVTSLVGTTIAAAITATSSSLIYHAPITARYIRLRIATTITGGSIQAFTRLSQVTWVPSVYHAVQPTAANLNVAIGNTPTVNLGTAGNGANSVCKAEDAVAASGDNGSFLLGVRRDVPTISSSAAGDYNEIATNKWGSINIVNFEKHAKTFSCSGVTASAASATDIAILPGNATNTVYVTKVIVSGIETTAGSVLVQLIKRSTANTGGTSVAMTAVPHESTDTPVSAPLTYNTTNPTVGTPIGNVRTKYLPLGSTTVASGDVVWEFGDKGKQIILSGVAQGLAVNLNGVTVTGGSFSITFEWIEI